MQTFRNVKNISSGPNGRKATEFAVAATNYGAPGSAETTSVEEAT